MAPFSSTGRLGSRPHKSQLVLPRSGLVALLDASVAASLTKTGSRVDGWADQSGSGNDFNTGFAGAGFNPSFDSGNQSVLFGQPTLLQSASNMSGVNRNAYTIIVVHKQTTKASFFLVGDHTNNTALAGSTAGRRMGPHNLFSGYAGYPVNTWVVTGVRNNGGTIHHLLNGSLYPNYLQQVNMAASQALGAVTLAFGPSGNFGSNMKAAAMWNRALTDAECVQAMAYLMKKCSVTADPLQASPVRNIVFDGNSIAYGYGLANATYYGSEAMYSLGFSDYDYKVVAFPGFTTSQVQSAYASKVAPLYNSNLAAKYNVYFMHEITNSLLNGANSTATVQTQLSAIVTAAKATGFKVVLGTCLPRTSAGANFETDRQTVNAWLLAGNSGADVIADFGGDATIGPQAAASSTTYYSDGTHPTDLAHLTYMAPIAKAAITAVTA